MAVSARALVPLAALGLLAGSGCAGPRPWLSDAPALQSGEPPVELVETPFFAQQDLHCGPAALATVLGAAGTAADPDSLADEVYTPGLGGSLQLELAAAARSRGYLPYVVPTEPDALLAELVAGRPVLVLQNLRLRSWPAWHYAVLIGADPSKEQLLLRSGAERRLVMSSGRFLQSWDRADRWALVLLEPGTLPALPHRPNYFAAVAGLEESGRYEAAARAWSAALRAWPGDPVASFGRATAWHLGGELDAARAAYAALLEDEPQHAAALNNLASLLGDLGCRSAALELAERAQSASPPGSAVEAAVLDTKATLESLAVGEGGTHCDSPALHGLR